jgi:hypothetical protein
MHEVIYLQFGNVPNFIGTHFWNAQDTYSTEEVNQQISWSLREGNRVTIIIYIGRTDRDSSRARQS